jgi:hypothetical protein
MKAEFRRMTGRQKDKGERMTGRMKAEFGRMKFFSYFIPHPSSFILPLRAFEKDEGRIQKDEIFFILHPSSFISHPSPSLYGHLKRMKAEFRRMTGRQKDKGGRMKQTQAYPLSFIFHISSFLPHPSILPFRAFEKDEGGMQKDDGKAEV